MKRVLALLLGMAALTVPTTYADARDGCGRGWFHNGFACVQQEGPRYGGGSGFYDDGPRYAPRQYYRQEPQYYGPPRPTMGRNGAISCNNPGYTFQDGACKPYTGR